MKCLGASLSLFILLREKSSALTLLSVARHRTAVFLSRSISKILPRETQIEGTVIGPLPNQEGGNWFATFNGVAPGNYRLIALVETSEDIQVHGVAGVGRPPGILAISILDPPAGGTVSNPIKVTGTVAGVGCTVTCTINSGGNQYNGVVTGPDGTGNWSATFPTIPSGIATITATVTQGASTATAGEGITVE